MQLTQTVQGNMTVLRDYFGDLARYLPDGAVVVALAQQRNHIASEPTHLAVGKDRFEAVADFRPVLVITDCEQDHHASVRSLVPDTPLLKKVVGEVFHCVTLQGLDGDQCDLGLGFLIDFRTQAREPFHRGGVEHAGKIIDVSLYVELLPLLRVKRRDGNDDKE